MDNAKIAIIYASVHHGNTKKILDVVAEKCGVELIDAVKVKEADLDQYDVVGFASGIYFSGFHRTVLEFAQANLPDRKDIFLLCTYGAKGDYSAGFMKAIADKHSKLTGYYGCRGFDTFGPFKIVGGIAKGHPDESDIAGAVEFVKGIIA